MKKILRFKRNEDGQSLVEFALALPMLMGLILGMIEFGWILNGQITVTNAAREGARVAVVCNDEASAYSAAETIAESSLTGATVNHPEFTTSWSNGNAKVILSAPITPIVGLFVHPDPSADPPGTVTLTATAVMRREN